MNSLYLGWLRGNSRRLPRFNPLQTPVDVQRFEDRLMSRLSNHLRVAQFRTVLLLDPQNEGGREFHRLEDR